MNNDIPERKVFYKTALDHIESTVLDLSYSISFDKQNLNSHVHSSQIADIILQCASHIESISKDLFTDYGFNIKNVPRKKLKYDNCLRKVIQAWQLEQRLVVSAPFLVGLQSVLFKPLKFNSQIKLDNQILPTWRWNKVYQSLKHDLISSQNKASIGMLLNILSVQMLLTTYYCDPICISSFSTFAEHATLPVVSKIFKPVFIETEHLSSKHDIDRATFLVLRSPSPYADANRFGHNMITILNKGNKRQIDDGIIERLKTGDYEN